MRGGRPPGRGTQRVPEAPPGPSPTHPRPPCRDINLSESEAEQDGTHNVLELPQAYAGRGNMKAQQSAVRLTEVRGGKAGGTGDMPELCRGSPPVVPPPPHRSAPA